MSAASAEEAFEHVEQWHPDILVSDIGLPDVDGYALIQKLRTLEAERGWSIPALAVLGGHPKPASRGHLKTGQ